MSLRVYERLIPGGADRADQLVLQILDAGAEARSLHVGPRPRRAAAGAGQAAPQGVLLADVARACQAPASSGQAWCGTRAEGFTDVIGPAWMAAMEAEAQVHAGQGVPLLWATTDPVPDAGRVWLALHEMAPQTGLVPITLAYLGHGLDLRGCGGGPGTAARRT